MAKRRTIGKSPLDDVVPGISLDAVLPGVPASPPASEAQPRAEAIPKAYRERLAALEQENAGLKAEVAELKTQLQELQALLKSPPADVAEPWWMTQLKEKLGRK
jgi:Tfp pilus assembly protein FimV